jgi:hypothetical protein
MVIKDIEVRDIEARDTGVRDTVITDIVTRDIGVMVTGITDIAMDTGTGETGVTIHLMNRKSQAQVQ